MKDLRERPAPVSLSRNKQHRPSKAHVSRVISQVGEHAGIIVHLEDERQSTRRKYASAHDLRRGCAQRLINAGISAETLKLLLRHKDFATTEKFYGAMRSAQAAAKEVQQRLAIFSAENPSLVGGLMGEKRKLLSYHLKSFGS